MGPHERRGVPAQETRGGNQVDWAKAQAGEPLPELPEAEYPEPDSKAAPDGWQDGIDPGNDFGQWTDALGPDSSEGQ